jgi:hypothetical protein
MSETFTDNRDDYSAQGGRAAADDGQAKPHGVAGVVHEARRQGEELADLAKERAAGFAEEQRALAAKQVGAVAGAVEKTAEELAGSSPDLAQYARSAATKARDLASALENRSVRDLIGTAESYARREPAIFFGAAVAAGFALARFLKSSPERRASGGSDVGSGVGYGTRQDSGNGSSYGAETGPGSSYRTGTGYADRGDVTTTPGAPSVASAAAPEGGSYGA